MNDRILILYLISNFVHDVENNKLIIMNLWSSNWIDQIRRDLEGIKICSAHFNSKPELTTLKQLSTLCEEHKVVTEVKQKNYVQESIVTMAFY